MKLRRLHILMLCCWTAFVFCACQHDDDASLTLSVDQRVVTIALNIDIPATEEYMTTRAMPGDPGTYEHFELPTVGYVYFVGIRADGTFVGVGKPAKLKEGTDDEELEELSNPITLSEWTKTKKDDDMPQTREDSIYRYRGNIHFIVPGGATAGRLYIAASKVELPDITTIDYATATEETVLNITFNVEGSAIRNNLQNVYSSPYNYKPKSKLDDSVLDGSTYYGTVTGLNSPEPKQVDLMLYHVAAKIDVDWNVVPKQQEKFWISFIEARKLCEKGCLLFRPTENECTELAEWDKDIDVPSQEKSYDLTLMGWNGKDDGGSFNNDRGRQWYGRQYFYAIPFRTKDTDYFDLQLRMLKNDDTQKNANDGYNLLLRHDLRQADPVFVPWLRIDLRFTNEMEYKKVTRTIND